MPKGTLLLIVGPSGAGKDTLVSEVLKSRPDLYLMPRTITRPAVDGEHIEVSAEEFSALKRNYGFALSWDANGCRYGVGRDLEERIERGETVILIGSRSMVDEARTKFQPIRVINVIAKLDVLARRLRERGREDEDDIDHRLGRADRSGPVGPDVTTIDNSGTLEDGVALMMAALNTDVPNLQE